jgi:hypothetical protein
MVSRIHAGWLCGLGSIPCMCKNFFLCSVCTGAGLTQHPFWWVLGVLSMGLKQLRSELTTHLYILGSHHIVEPTSCTFWVHLIDSLMWFIMMHGQYNIKNSREVMEECMELYLFLPCLFAWYVVQVQYPMVILIMWGEGWSGVPGFWTTEGKLCSIG